MSQSHTAFIESHILRRFTILKKVGSGAYGHVWKVEEKSTKKIYALKKIFDAFQHATDAQRTYREIEILKQTNHPNIIKLFETIRADNNKDVYLLFQFMEADLHNVISENILKEVHIRFIIYQMAKSLKYLHSGNAIHRDLKPSNVLVNSNCTIKLCDFGLVRSLASSKDNNTGVMTEGVATRWYRAPEVLMGSKSYSTPADVWSYGCIIYEILAQKPLFPGGSTVEQIQKICAFTGYPTEEDINSLDSEIAKSMIKEIKLSNNSKQNNIMKDIPEQFVGLLQKILVFNPKKRISIQDILEHQLVKAFRKPEEETSCEKEIHTSIDDNYKFAVDEYRKLVYGNQATKSKALSASLGTGSSSTKYIPTKAYLNSTTSHLQKQKSNEMLGKYVPYEKSKNVSSYTPSYIKDSYADKKYEKPQLKYVRSAKQISKVVDHTNSSSTNSNLYVQHKKFPQKKDNNQIHNKQETDKSSSVKTTPYSGYVPSRPSYSKNASSENLQKNLDNNYKTQKSSLQQFHQKSTLYKSPKYIAMKGQSSFKAVRAEDKTKH